MAIPPKGVSDSPYKKYAIERALEEEGVPASLSTISSRLSTLATKIDKTNELLQELVDK